MTALQTKERAMPTALRKTIKVVAIAQAFIMLGFVPTFLSAAEYLVLRPAKSPTATPLVCTPDIRCVEQDLSGPSRRRT